MESLFALAALMLAGTPAQADGVDPAATQILKRMTDHLDNLQQFSVRAENTLEDLLESGQRVDIDVSADNMVGRSRHKGINAESQLSRLLSFQNTPPMVDLND